MTIKELVEKLEEFDNPEMVVKIFCPECQSFEEIDPPYETSDFGEELSFIGLDFNCSIYKEENRR